LPFIFYFIRAKIALSFASPEKEKYFLFIYEVITWGKILKRPSIHYCYIVGWHRWILGWGD
jgi:hypothetical protein